MQKGVKLGVGLLQHVLAEGGKSACAGGARIQRRGDAFRQIRYVWINPVVRDSLEYVHVEV